MFVAALQAASQRLPAPAWSCCTWRRTTSAGLCPTTWGRTPRFAYWWVQPVQGLRGLQAWRSAGVGQIAAQLSAGCLHSLHCLQTLTQYTCAARPQAHGLTASLFTNSSAGPGRQQPLPAAGCLDWPTKWRRDRAPALAAVSSGFVWTGLASLGSTLLLLLRACCTGCAAKALHYCITQ